MSCDEKTTPAENINRPKDSTPGTVDWVIEYEKLNRPTDGQ